MMYRILMIEDDRKISAILSDYLMKYDYDVHTIQQFDQIKHTFIQCKPDLVLMDINLPYFDGFYWCRQIRTISNIPVIFISARTDEMNQVMAIEHGGDDYITKPFHLDVVVAKIKGVLRRTYGEYSLSSAHQPTLDLSGLFLYQDKHELEWQQQKLSLTNKEYRLLHKLAENHDRIVSRDDLLEALWDDIDFVDDNTLTVNVTRTRKRLAELGIHEAIQTVRGQGYRLHVNWKVNE